MSNEPALAFAAPSTQDALSLVREDHKRVIAALDALLASLAAGGSDADRQGLLSRVALRLRAHGVMECELLYPALYPDAPAHPSEHAQFELALQALSAPATSLQQQSEGTAVLSGLLRQHFEQEERDLLVHAADSDTDLLELGTRMALRRGELLADEGSD